MNLIMKIFTLVVYCLAAQLVAGCVSWQPRPTMAPPEARVALRETFVAALHDAGDPVAAAIADPELSQYIGIRPIGNNGVIFLYKDSGQARFAYALLSLPEATHLGFSGKSTENNSQDRWRVEFVGNDAGWATGYTDQEPFFALTTVELNDRHKGNHNRVLWFKRAANMKLFLNALTSLYPQLTF